MNFTDIINTLVNIDLSRNTTRTHSYNAPRNNFLPGRSNIIRYIDDVFNENNSSQIFNRMARPTGYNFDLSDNNVINDISSNSSFNNSTDAAYGSFLENLFMNPISTTPQPQNTTSYLQRLLTETLSQQNNYKRVISEQGKKSISNEKYTAVKYPDQKCCPISQKNFKEGDDISKLPCGHIFDPGLITKWLENENATCPVCRFKLDSKEIPVEKSNETEETSRPPAIPIRRTHRVSQHNPESFFRRSMYNLLIQQERNREEQDIQRALVASLETFDEEQSSNTSELDDID